MRHKILHSIAHNFAQSIASGHGGVVGRISSDADVFVDAAANENSEVIIDFLAGRIMADYCSDGLRGAITTYQRAFPDFCTKNGAKASDYRTFRVRFISPHALGKRYIVTVEDSAGRRSSREYEGIRGRRVMLLDDRGRFRPKIHLQPDLGPDY